MSENWGEPETPLLREQRWKDEARDVALQGYVGAHAGAWRPKYEPVHVAELLARVLPPRELLLGPWFPARSLAMIYGARGVGKSLLSLSIAASIASGNPFLNWVPTGSRAVLYVDGEMTLHDLQSRAQQLLPVDASSVPLHFIARDLYSHWMPALNKKDLRVSIQDAAKSHDAALIVIDNLSTLWRGAENDAEAWDAMQDWLFELRGAGHSVLLVHHAGKNGAQRGSSKKEDALEVVLALRRPERLQQVSGAAFNVFFEKTRQRVNGGSAPFFASLDNDGAQGLAAWHRGPVVLDGETDRMIALRDKGLTLEQIAGELGCDKSTVSRRLKQASKDQPVPQPPNPSTEDELDWEVPN